MKKLITLILIIQFGMSGIVWSQGTDFGTITPPSPEATSLAKFTDIPVSHYTGLPQISVPLYSFEIDGVKVPVGLSYHARGIGVEEVASRVGIGWALNAGGAVVRQTRGKPDDLAQGYLQDDFYKTFEDSVSTRESVYSDLLSNLVDLEPDCFSFNFLGYSGKFYFDQWSDPKQIVLEQYSDIDIKPIFDYKYWRLLGWVITTEDGFKYYFGMPKFQNQTIRIARSYDNSQNFRATLLNYSSIEGESSEVYNSWQLIDIVSPTGRTVVFNYERECPTFWRKSYDTVEKDGAQQVDKCVSYFSKVSTVQNQLKSIDFDGGKMIFTREKDAEGEDVEREDLEGGYTLQYIEVVDDYNKLIKKYRLDYSYSYDASTKNVFTTLTKKDSRAAKRLFLDSVTELSGDKELPPYKFEYFNKNDLPNRFSTSQDYWGYYNGKNNGRFLNIINTEELGDDKTVDTIKAKTGLIERIIYPTGGYAEYNFEANKAIPPSYFSQLELNQVNPKVRRSVPFLKHIKYRVSIGLYESDEFTVSNTIIGYLHSNVNSLGSNTNLVKIINSSGSVVMTLYDGANDFIIADDLSPGTYKIQVKVLGFDDPYDIQLNGFSVGINWEEETVPQSELFYSGGNRIKEIVLNDANGETIKKRYEYLGKNGKSSGLVYALPCYSFVSTFTGDGVHYKGVLKPGSPLSYSQGNHIGYSSVTEYIESNEGGAGKTQYFFTSMNDVGEFWKFPYTIPDDNESYRGKPLRIDYYKWNNTPEPYSLVKRTNYNYMVYGENEYFGTVYMYQIDDPIMSKPLLKEHYIDKLKFCLPLIVFCGTSDFSQFYNSYQTYYLRGGTMQLKSLQNIDYFEGNSVESLETFVYNNVDNYQLIESQKSNSDGKIITNRNYYPHDYSDILDVYSLSLSNIISKPVDVRTYVDNKLVSGQQIKYNNIGQPIEVYKFEESVADIPFNRNSPYTFSHKQTNSYSIKGKIKEVDKESGETNSFIWGYNNTLPIAKIENATYEEVETVLGKEVVAEIGLSNDTAFINSKMRLLRADPRMNNAQITSYTHKPLVGVTSVTDPNGVTTHYDYDDFGRLEYVRDNDGNIINSNAYQYQSQSIIEDCRISTTVTGGGTISPSGTVMVPIGSSKTFTATPTVTTKVKRILVNGAVVVDNTVTGGLNTKPFSNTDSKSYTVNNILANTNVTAEFEPRKYAVTVSNSGLGGENSVAPFITYADYGSSRTFNFTEKDGYEFINVKVNGLSVGKKYSHTELNITKDIIVVAEYRVCDPNSLTIFPAKFFIDGPGGSDTFDIITCGNWTVTNVSSSKWLTIDKTSGSGNSTVTLSVPFLRIGIRTATLEVKAGNTTKLVTIKQVAEDGGMLE